ncbi:Crp/Fnr family transcriptional regulator [Chloroflexus sp.]|uniref:Crp/Fnr family transcriptional regulator n=1 Tax=Chloroflexus sp. TaxID=1904827 RepID=UPI0040490A4E
MHMLECYRLFKGLDRQTLDDIAAYARILHTQRHMTLFEEHASAEMLYAVQNGWVRLYKLAANGRQSVIRLSGPSDIVGISAVLPEGMYTLTAQTISPCRLLTWRARDLHHLLDRYPVLQNNSLQLLSEYRDHLQQQFLELATENVEQRLAHTLVRLADQYGTPTGAPGQTKIPLMQRDLADLIGVSHYTVNRLLHFWQEQGLVQSRRGCLVIIDRRQLLARTEPSPEP